MKKLKIRIGEVEVKAKLLFDKAPNLIKMLESLPLEGNLTHAKICDNEVILQVPGIMTESENIVLPQAGDIGYWDLRQTICIWYDDMKPLGQTNLFAKIVPEDLPKFAAEATKVWKNPGTFMKIEFFDDEEV